VLGNTNQEEKHQYRARKLYKESVTSKVRQIACNSNSLVALLGTLCPLSLRRLLFAPKKLLTRCVALYSYFFIDFFYYSETGEIVIIDVLESNAVTLSFLSDKNIIQIACGQNHLIALSDTGLVYTCTRAPPLRRLLHRLLTHHGDTRHTRHTGGVDNHGALGHGKVVQQKSPLAIKALDEVLVQKVVCNKCCTIVLEDFWATQLLRYPYPPFSLHSSHFGANAARLPGQSHGRHEGRRDRGREGHSVLCLPQPQGADYALPPHGLPVPPKPYRLHHHPSTTHHRSPSSLFLTLPCVA
jgi:hypothetical protein